MATVIYGSPRSRTLRVLWMAAELGLEHEHVPLSFEDPALKEPAFIPPRRKARRARGAGRCGRRASSSRGVQQDARLAPLRAAVGGQANAAIAHALRVLDSVLATRVWLLGAHFTVADLNVAAVLSPSRTQRLDLAPFARVGDWLQRCYARPAAVATRKRFDAFVDPSRAGRPQ